MLRIFFFVVLLTFVIPSAVNFCFAFELNKTKIHNKKIINNKIKNLEVNKKNNTKIEINQLEDYLKLVVAEEMPAYFEIEALKAQAVASRSYAVKNYNGKDLKELYQAYSDIEKLKEKWNNDFDKYYKKICFAVDSTKGQIIKYNNDVALAVFHSTSAGVTQNSEDVWKNELPYLKSVDSYDDINALNFVSYKTFKISDICQKINKKFETDINKNNFENNFKVSIKSNSGYIKKLKICEKDISAMEFRMLLDLRSTNFEFYLDKDNSQITFKTKGYGHGVGMSQYGAHYMAKKGFNYVDILKHYYSGVHIEKMDIKK
ncbi:MAG: stage II sporulation protein D [Clostridiales bacterium]|nr:stage II sporulation protein D [Clostridiales bacterium]